MTDPDATSRAHPVMGEMCHWIVTGISFQMPASDQPATLAPAHIGLGATDLTDQDVSITNITELMSYLTPSPPPKTGLHRYVFVLLAPAASDALDLSGGLKKPKERPHWGYGKVGKGVRDWARENGLVAIGEYTLISLTRSKLFVKLYEIRLFHALTNLLRLNKSRKF